MRTTRLKTILLIAALSAAATPAAAQPGGKKKDRAAAGDEAGKEEAAAPAEGKEGAEEAAEEAEATPQPAGVDALRQEYLALRDKLFRSRARAAAVASALYSTKLTLYLHHESGRHWTITRASLRLDGADVFDDTQGSIAADKAPRFEGYVAPGRHVVAVHIEATAKDDERFSTILDNQFVIQAPKGKDVSVIVKAEDEGNLAYRWRKKQQGSYAPHLSVEINTSDRNEQGETKLRGN